MCFCVGVVNISTEGVQGGTTFLEVLTASDFSATNTSRDGDLDALGTSPHSGGDSVFDSTAVLDATLDLLGNILSDEYSIQLRALHFTDVNLDILAGQLLKFFTEFIHLGASTTNNKTRTGGTNRDGEKFEGSLNIDFRDTGLGQASVEVLANLIILNKLLLKLSSTEPARIPSADDA